MKVYVILRLGWWREEVGAAEGVSEPTEGIDFCLRKIFLLLLMFYTLYFCSW